MIRWGNRTPAVRSPSERWRLFHREPLPIAEGETERERKERSETPWDEWMRKSAESIERKAARKDMIG